MAFYLFFVVEMEWYLTHLTQIGHSQKGSNYSTKGKPDMTHPDESEGTDQLSLLLKLSLLKPFG